MKLIKALTVGIAATVALTVSGTPTTAAPAQATRAAAQLSTPSPSEQSLLHRQARSDAELRAQIDLQLKVAPGGTRVGSNQVAYADGKFVVTYALPGQQALGVPECPGGWFCFYDGKYFGYPRGMASEYGWLDLTSFGWHNRISSVHNNTPGRVDYYDSQFGYASLLFPNYPYSAVGDLGPADNKADHANHRY